VEFDYHSYQNCNLNGLQKKQFVGNTGNRSSQRELELEKYLVDHNQKLAQPLDSPNLSGL
jgi:hypothetical protein